MRRRFWRLGCFGRRCADQRRHWPVARGGRNRAGGRGCACGRGGVGSAGRGAWRDGIGSRRAGREDGLLGEGWLRAGRGPTPSDRGNADDTHGERADGEGDNPLGGRLRSAHDVVAAGGGRDWRVVACRDRDRLRGGVTRLRLLGRACWDRVRSGGRGCRGGFLCDGADEQVEERLCALTWVQDAVVAHTTELSVDVVGHCEGAGVPVVSLEGECPGDDGIEVAARGGQRIS